MGRGGEALGRRGVVVGVVVGGGELRLRTETAGSLLKM